MGAEQNFAAVQAIRVLRRRFLSILVPFIVIPVAAFFIFESQMKQYTATASVLFTSQTAAEQLVGVQPNDAADTAVSQATDAQLLELGDIATVTAASVGHGLTAAAVSSAITVAPSATTNIVQVSATTDSPSLSTELANTYCRVFSSQQQSQSQADYVSALRVTTRQLAALSPVQRRGATGLALQSRAQSLGLLVAVDTPPVQVVQSASVPSSPSSPKTKRNTVLAAIVGLFLGIALAFGRERLDQAIREPTELAEIYGLPLLGVVPQSSALASKSRRKVESGVLPNAEPETFYLLNAHLRYFNVDRELQTILVASAIPETGKTTISCQLAAASARLGKRVLLLESDMRRPAIARRIGLTGGAGLADVLIGAVKFEDAVQEVIVALTGNRSADTHRTCDVLTAGLTVPPNPGELIGSKAMESLLAHVCSAYDTVIIDSPPVTVVADAYPLLKRADGVLVVGRISSDRRDVARRSAEALRRTGANLLGVVANGVRRSALRQYGDYGYPGRTEQGPTLTRPVDKAVQNT